MATITTLTGSDGVTEANSMTKINTNFTNLNNDKIETSYLDTDTTLAANSDVKIATQKAVKTYVDANIGIESETTTGTTHSLTTTASQKVVVWAKGNYQRVDGGDTAGTLTLKYNGVTKDTLSIKPDGVDDIIPFSLVYTETPGAATANITVEQGTAGSNSAISNVVIVVLKIPA